MMVGLRLSPLMYIWKSLDWGQQDIATCWENKVQHCIGHTWGHMNSEAGYTSHSAQNGRATSFYMLVWATSPLPSEWSSPIYSDPIGHLLRGQLTLAWGIPDSPGWWPPSHMLSGKSFFYMRPYHRLQGHL